MWHLKTGAASLFLTQAEKKPDVNKAGSSVGGAGDEEGDDIAGDEEGDDNAGDRPSQELVKQTVRRNAQRAQGPQ